MLTINEEKCEKCGICADVCPIQIISLSDKMGFPQINSGMEDWCLSCGHCVSVCPNTALSHARVNTDECPLIKQELVIDLEQTTQFLRSRRSIRSFSKTPVENFTVQKLIEVARYAPTGSNTQLLEWTVINGADQVREISQMIVAWMKSLVEKGDHESVSPYILPVIQAWEGGYDMILRSAPTLVIVAAPNDTDFCMVDVLLALSYMELAAPKFGLGGCWAGLLHNAMRHHQPLRTRLGLTERLPNYFPMILGYPKYEYYRLTERRPPKITWM